MVIFFFSFSSPIFHVLKTLGIDNLQIPGGRDVHLNTNKKNDKREMIIGDLDMTHGDFILFFFFNIRHCIF